MFWECMIGAAVGTVVTYLFLILLVCAVFWLRRNHILRALDLSPDEQPVPADTEGLQGLRLKKDNVPRRTSRQCKRATKCAYMASLSMIASAKFDLLDEESAIRLLRYIVKNARRRRLDDEIIQDLRALIPEVTEEMREFASKWMRSYRLALGANR